MVFGPVLKIVYKCFNVYFGKKWPHVNKTIPESVQNLGYVELGKWHRKTVATNSEIQYILGKLMWVARAVKFSHCFVLRITCE